MIQDLKVGALIATLQSKGALSEEEANDLKTVESLIQHFQETGIFTKEEFLQKFVEIARICISLIRIVKDVKGNSAREKEIRKLFDFQYSWVSDRARDELIKEFLLK